MTNRQKWAACCFLFALALRVHDHADGTYGSALWLEPLNVSWAAFMLPAVLPVMLVEEYGFQMEPWAAGNHALTLLWLTITATAIWFFPLGRIQRWFGSFDAFGERKRRLPSLSRGMATVLDTINRLKIGKGKMGGWA